MGTGNHHLPTLPIVHIMLHSTPLVRRQHCQGEVFVGPGLTVESQDSD